jgi:hypothetical protein
MIDVQQLVEEGAVGLGLLYLAGTVTAAMIAVITGSGVTWWVLEMAQRKGNGHEAAGLGLALDDLRRRVR